MPFNPICNVVGCDNPVEGRTEMCATHNYEQRKADKQSKKVQIVKPVTKISGKRAEHNLEYSKLRKEYLEAYPACEVEDCHNKSIEVHHMRGRENDLLLNTNYFLAVCHDCHVKITKDSEWARNKGYSVSRTSNKDLS